MKEKDIDLREKFGDWFLDIAKYGVTVLVLSPLFGDVNNIWLTIGAILIIASSLVAAIALYRKQKSNYKKTRR